MCRNEHLDDGTLDRVVHAMHVAAMHNDADVTIPRKDLEALWDSRRRFMDLIEIAEYEHGLRLNFAEAA